MMHEETPPTHDYGNSRFYRLGFEYIDRGGTKKADDQFLRWLNIPGSGMLNSPGIRPLSFVNGDAQTGLPAYLVLVTTQAAGSTHNPWQDVIDVQNGLILYWGDAKFDGKARRYDAFPGNRVLRAIHDALLNRRRNVVPPILHFSKKQRGKVQFNGLCVLDRLEATWFEDHRRGASRPVANYRAHLTILDCEEVPVQWLHARALSGLTEAADMGAPSAWREYLTGRTRRLRVWKKLVRDRRQQLPAPNSIEGKALADLASLRPAEFEQVLVSLFEQLPEVPHKVEQTRLVGDGGFDFSGRFSIPHPINYEIPFKGEAKRYAPRTGVGPKDVSRLVARLGRGEFGIFVTTSYYTRQAQEEVVQDCYPVRLFAGLDLINILTELQLCADGCINRTWLEQVLGPRDRWVGQQDEAY